MLLTLTPMYSGWTLVGPSSRLFAVPAFWAVTLQQLSSYLTKILLIERIEKRSREREREREIKKEIVRGNTLSVQTSTLRLPGGGNCEFNHDALPNRNERCLFVIPTFACNPRDHLVQTTVISASFER